MRRSRRASNLYGTILRRASLSVGPFPCVSHRPRHDPIGLGTHALVATTHPSRPRPERSEDGGPGRGERAQAAGRARIGGWATPVPFQATYDTFGTVTAVGTTLLDWIPFGFAGGMYDPETGLVRFGARDRTHEAERIVE